MATGNRNNNSQLKNIRFPHEVLEKIDGILEIEKQDFQSSNFSSWVLDACAYKILISGGLLSLINEMKEDFESPQKFISRLVHEEARRRKIKEQANLRKQKKKSKE